MPRSRYPRGKKREKKRVGREKRQLLFFPSARGGKKKGKRKEEKRPELRALRFGNDSLPLRRGGKGSRECARNLFKEERKAVTLNRNPKKKKR